MLLLLMMYTRRVWPLNEIRYMYSLHTHIIVHPNIYKTEKTFKNEQRSKDVAAKKRPTTSGVGKINNYYEDIYIPPNNNTNSPHLYIVTIPIDSTH